MYTVIAETGAINAETAALALSIFSYSYYKKCGLG